MPLPIHTYIHTYIRDELSGVPTLLMVRHELAQLFVLQRLLWPARCVLALQSRHLQT